MKSQVKCDDLKCCTSCNVAATKPKWTMWVERQIRLRSLRVGLFPKRLYGKTSRLSKFQTGSLKPPQTDLSINKEQYYLQQAGGNSLWSSAPTIASKHSWVQRSKTTHPLQMVKGNHSAAGDVTSASANSQEQPSHDGAQRVTFSCGVNGGGDRVARGPYCRRVAPSFFLFSEGFTHNISMLFLWTAVLLYNQDRAC